MDKTRQPRRSIQSNIGEPYDRLAPADFFRGGLPIVLWSQTILKKELHTKPKAADPLPTRSKQVSRAAQVSSQLERRKELLPNRIDIDFERTASKRSHKQSAWLNRLKPSRRALKPLTYSQHVSPSITNKSPVNALIKCESIIGLMALGGGRPYKHFAKKLTSMPNSLQSSPPRFKADVVEPLNLSTSQPKSRASVKESPSITVVLRRTKKASAPQQVKETQLNVGLEQLPKPDTSVHKAQEQKRPWPKMTSYASQPTVKSSMSLSPWSCSSEELRLLQ
jgi:hypothetical protein